MPSRWKHDRPLSRAEFEARFPDDAACATYLAARRWPDGFVCPGCGGAGARFDRSFLAIAAAVDGLGVALESTRLAEREIASGALLSPLAGRARDIRYVGHYLIYSEALRHRRSIRSFTSWLLGELGLAPPAG